VAAAIARVRQQVEDQHLEVRRRLEQEMTDADKTAEGLERRLQASLWGRAAMRTDATVLRRQGESLGGPAAEEAPASR